jgi:hypothetical protein
MGPFHGSRPEALSAWVGTGGTHPSQRESPAEGPERECGRGRVAVPDPALGGCNGEASAEHPVERLYPDSGGGRP